MKPDHSSEPGTGRHKSSGLRGLVNLFRETAYRNYTLANGVSLTGGWTQRVVIGWLTWEATRSASWLGVLAFVDLFPTVLCGVVAGSVIDRRGALAVVRATEIAGLLQCLTLAALHYAGALGMGAILGLTALLGIANAFNHPARLALAPQLVTRANLPLALVVNATLFSLARFIGPALAGFVLLADLPGLAFILNGMSFCAVLAVLSRLPLVASPAREASGSSGFAANIGSGFHAAWSHVGVRSLLAFLLVSSLGARALVELLPSVADELFGAGADGLALLTSALGLGATLSGVLLAQLGISRIPSLLRLVLGSTVALALANAVLVATGDLYIGLAAAGLAGVATVAGAIGTLTILQMTVADHYRGRILSLYGMILRGSPAVGAILLGASADLFGTREAILGGAAVVLAGAGWFYLERERIRASWKTGARERADPR